MRITAEISLTEAAILRRVRFERGNGVDVISISKAIACVLNEWARQNPAVTPAPTDRAEHQNLEPDGL